MAWTKDSLKAYLEGQQDLINKALSIRDETKVYAIQDWTHLYDFDLTESQQLKATLQYLLNELNTLRNALGQSSLSETDALNGIKAKLDALPKK